MREVFILETDLRGPKIIQINKRFCKKLGVDILSLGFDLRDLEDLEDVIKAYDSPSIGLRIDLLDKLSRLLGLNKENLYLKDPRIRKSLYQFLKFLEKRGLMAAELESLEVLRGPDRGLIEAVRELRKNSFTDEFFSYTKLSGSKDLLIALSSENFKALKAVKPEGLIFDDFLAFKSSIGSFIKDFSDNKSDLILGLDNLYSEDINYKNYPTYARRLMMMGLFFLKSSLILEEGSLIKDDLDFIESLAREKSKLAGSGFREIIPKDTDIFSFIRESDKAKVLVLLNFSQSEVLLDLSYAVMDYKDYDFLLGTYGQRKLFKTLVLRPYEGIAFEKNIAL